MKSLKEIPNFKPETCFSKSVRSDHLTFSYNEALKTLFHGPKGQEMEEWLRVYHSEPRRLKILKRKLIGLC